MGFFNSCWEALLQLASYAQSSSLKLDLGQQPLALPHANNVHAHVQAAGPVFAPAGSENGFVCDYSAMVGYTACNSASDRQCWLKSSSKDAAAYNITTNYEELSLIPKGITREYWLETSTEAIAPDGYVKPLAQIFNGSYPGPNLQACWGDQLVIHVTNKIPNLGTTVHWHGIRQFQSNQYDGVNGVTQCPIAFGKTFTYNFTIQQLGHTWYHSHYQTQYSDGMAGPLTIYGPSSANYDVASTPILINDWVHDNTSVAFKQELAGGIPLADSVVVGGHARYRCSDLDPFCCNSCSNVTGPSNAPKCPPGSGILPEYCCTPSDMCFKNGKKLTGSLFSTTFVEGKRYLLKLINASAGAMFIFMIDEHELEVIQTDLVPIHPYKTDSLFIGIGQRYQVIVTAKPKRKSIDGNYWMRTRVAQGCGNVAQDDETTGVVTYSTFAAVTPSTNANTGRNNCSDEDPSKLRPMVPWNVTGFKGNQGDFTFQAAIDTNVTNHAFRWDLADQPLFLNYGNPALLNTENASYINDGSNAVIKYDFDSGYVFLIVDGKNLLNKTVKTSIPAAHPIHLHGHDFVILSQQDSTWDGVTIPPFNTNNPPRRDVALLYGGGYLAMAFKPDNPGIWLVHCHIAWHASSGLALQILERQNEIVPWLGGLPDVRQTCDEWHKMDLQFAQDDSGI